MICTVILSVLSTGALAAQGSSGRVVSTALSQVGYTEALDEYTKYGQWYGFSHGYWCDMFVSWCADQAQISQNIFPLSASCTAHVNSFKTLGRYMPSAARGGSYVPQQGDLIFFYKPHLSPNGAVVSHTGIVLYTENGYVYTIEGNALPNRLDCDYILLSTLRDQDGDLEPPDYVTVNYYPLDAVQIHGYASPDYADRQPLALNGFVDLGRHAALSGQFTRLYEEGIMSPTSSHTFSPRHGMFRGEFLQSVMTLCGLSSWNENTQPFTDVPQDSPWYNAVMTARCAGIIQGTGSNTFSPDAYISGAAAQTILSNALAYLGLEDRTFSFSKGDIAYVCGTYTIRADLAAALYALRTDIPLPTAYDAAIDLNGEVLEWSPVQINGSCYISLAELQQQFPALIAVPQEETEISAAEESQETAKKTTSTEATEAAEEETEAAGDTEADIGAETTFSADSVDPDTGLPIPLAACNRVIPEEVIYAYGDGSAAISTFSWEGKQYLALRSTAALLGLDVTWHGDTFSISLTEPAE